MKRVCAWCNSKMNSQECDDEGSEELVTHSICDECSDNLDFQLGVSLDRYLNSLKIPVIALDTDDGIIAVNHEALKLHPNETLNITKSWNGKVFECAHARLPEGCNRCVHCSGCAIRSLTAETFKTGSRQEKIPAHTHQCSSALEKADLLISTEIIDGTVILRLEPR